MSCDKLKFKHVAELLYQCELCKHQKGKKVSEAFRIFVDTHMPKQSDDFFQLLRLLLPQFDSRIYRLKEAGLAKALVEGANLSKTAKATTLREWQTGGKYKLGNLASVAEEVLFDKLGEAGKDLTVKQVNEALTNLEGASDFKARAMVVRQMMADCPSRQMKYLVMIILKDLKVGLSERIVLRNFHTDAEDLFNLVSNLEEVCTKLKDREKRFPRQDVQIGSNVRSQRAAKATEIAGMFKKMKKREFVVESKFDGWRIQLHVDEGMSTKYFSRNSVEHGVSSSFNCFDPVVRDQVVHSRAILDGELVVWHKVNKRFEPFWCLQRVVHMIRDEAAKDTVVSSEGKNTADPSHIPPLIQDLELMYVAFDIIYAEDRSVIHLPLRERHQILLNALRPPSGKAASGVSLGGSGVSGRICPLVPSIGPEWGGLGKDWSMIGHSQEDIQNQFDAALQHQEEGIVVKDLDSSWVPNDKYSGAWLKLKPDYVYQQEIDALIIGGYYGTGKNSGKISEFLLGILAPSPHGDAEPHLASFTKVATGFSDKDRADVRERLAPAMISAKEAKVPNYLTVKKANQKHISRSVMPDVWIKDPKMSVVVQVQGDVRLMKTKSFAAGYSLRFPRATRIRYDKGCHDVMSVKELGKIIEDNKGVVRGAEGHKDVSLGRQKQRMSQKSPSSAFRSSAAVIDRFQPVDLTGVQRMSEILKGCKFYFLEHGILGKQHLEELVAKHGGETYQSLTVSVTHILAPPEVLDSSSSSSHSLSAHRERDVLSIAWLDGCILSSRLLKPQPRHYLNISAETLRNLEDCDVYGDNFYEEVEQQDVRALLRQVARLPPFEKARHYVRGLAVGTQRQYEEWAKRSRSPMAVLHPDIVYNGRGWKSWDNWLCKSKAHKFMTFHEACEWIHTSGLGRHVRHEADWHKWAASFDRPDTMPSEPHRYYQAQQQWVSWEQWLRCPPLLELAAGTDGGQPCRQNAAEVVEAIEAELVDNGLGAPAPFRGCRFLLVDLDVQTSTVPMAVPSNLCQLSINPLQRTAEFLDVARLRSRNLQCKVRMGGGISVLIEEVASCTHIIVCQDLAAEAISETSDMPARMLRKFLARLQDMGADTAALQGLHAQLVGGRLSLVLPQWVADQSRMKRSTMSLAELAPLRPEHRFLESDAQERLQASQELWKEAAGIDITLAVLRAQVERTLGGNGGGLVALQLASRLRDEGTTEALLEAAGLCQGLLDASQRQQGKAEAFQTDQVQALLTDIRALRDARTNPPNFALPEETASHQTASRSKRRASRATPSITEDIPEARRPGKVLRVADKTEQAGMRSKNVKKNVKRETGRTGSIPDTSSQAEGCASLSTNQTWHVLAENVDSPSSQSRTQSQAMNSHTGRTAPTGGGKHTAIPGCLGRAEGMSGSSGSAMATKINPTLHLKQPSQSQASGIRSVLAKLLEDSDDDDNALSVGTGNCPAAGNISAVSATVETDTRQEKDTPKALTVKSILDNL